MTDDWSTGRRRDLLGRMRRFLWREDTLALHAAWMGIEPGMTVVDVGCGLGYLGSAYWPWFGAGGLYVGVDGNARLLADATEAAAGWADGGEAAFLRGDAGALPIRDNRADWTVCQTLLMHLGEPERAIAEMVRVTRPGGLVTAIEPDNLAAMVWASVRAFEHLPIEDRLLLVKTDILQIEGRRRRGQGDSSIGGRLTRLLHEAGLESIDVRLGDRVNHLEPPYEGELQQWLFELLTKEPDADRNDALRQAGEDYVGAGGTSEEWARAVEIFERQSALDREALRRGEHYHCRGGPFYVAIGRKPVLRGRTGIALFRRRE
jgi:ubiquinone/menaquinone biosynthesis C-methylase UbiE